MSVSELWIQTRAGLVPAAVWGKRDEEIAVEYGCSVETVARVRRWVEKREKKDGED